MFFNGDDGRIVGRYHKWVKNALAVTVAMFWQMGLEANLDKTKAVVCIPGFIWGKWVKLEYKIRATGEG